MERLGPGHPPSGLVEQPVGRRPAHTHDQAIAGDFERPVQPGAARVIQGSDRDAADSDPARAGKGAGDRVAGEDGDPRGADLLGQCGRLTRGTQVDHRRDGDTGPVQVERGLVALGVGGQHDAAVARFDRVEMDQPLRRGREHHTRQVIIAEDGRLFDAARGDDHAPGAQLHQAGLVDQCHPQVSVGTGRYGGGADLQVRQRGRSFEECRHLRADVRRIRPLV